MITGRDERLEPVDPISRRVWPVLLRTGGATVVPRGARPVNELVDEPLPAPGSTRRAVDRVVPLSGSTVVLLRSDGRLA